MLHLACPLDASQMSRCAISTPPNDIVIEVNLHAIRSRLSKAVDGIKVGFALQIRQDLGTFGVRYVIGDARGKCQACHQKARKGGVDLAKRCNLWVAFENCQPPPNHRRRFSLGRDRWGRSIAPITMPGTEATAQPHLCSSSACTANTLHDVLAAFCCVHKFSWQLIVLDVFLHGPKNVVTRAGPAIPVTYRHSCCLMRHGPSPVAVISTPHTDVIWSNYDIDVWPVCF